MKKGSSPSYDLCQGAFDELSPAQARQYERIPPPITPRRAILALGVAASVALAWSLSRGGGGAQRSAPPAFYRDDEVRFTGSNR